MEKVSSQQQQPGQEDAAASGAFDSLLYNLFQPPRSKTLNSVVIAFTSASRGEGVTHVVCSLSQAMRRKSMPRAIQVDMDWLKSQSSPTARPTSSANVQLGSGWKSSWELPGSLLQQLRSRFQYVAIDCPALSASNDVLSLAKLVDGIVLVVEAQRTSKSQIRNAERQIEAAGGRVLGSILNKRRYPIPDYFYNLL